MKKKNVWRLRNTTFCARCQDSGQDVPYTSIKIGDFSPFGFFVDTFQVLQCSITSHLCILSFENCGRPIDVTTLRSRMVDRFPAEPKNFALLQIVHTSCAAHLISYSFCTGISFYPLGQTDRF